MKHEQVKDICATALATTRRELPATRFIPFSRDTKSKTSLQRWLKYEVAFRMLDQHCPVRDVAMYLNMSAKLLRSEYINYLCRDKYENV